MKRLFPLIAAIAAMSLAPAARAGETQLSAASIHGLFPGYYEAKVYGGYTLLIAARADGRLDGTAFGTTDRGNWRIVGDELCVAWFHWTSGQDKCGQILQTGGWYVAYSADEGQLLRFRAIAADAFSQQTASASGTDRK